MSESETTSAPSATESAKPKGPNKTPSTKAGLSRKTLRSKRRKVLKAKLVQDKEFAKAYFEGRSKRSIAKKLAYKKRHAKKAS